MICVLLLFSIFSSARCGGNYSIITKPIQHVPRHYHEHWLLDYLTSLPRSNLISYEDVPQVVRNNLPTAHKDPNDSAYSLATYFDPQDFATLQALMTSFPLSRTSRGEANTSNSLWSDIITDISAQNPFIFFHQRKAGGSSLRTTLQDAGLELKIPYFIPCADDVSCDTYTFPFNRIGSTALFAGHFRWGVQSDLARGGIEHKYSRTHFSCVTNYRHPIDRIESCIYYRFQPDKCLMNMSPERLKKILGFVDPFGTTCLNEPFRSMSGFQEDAVIDHLMDGDFDGTESDFLPKSTVTANLFKRQRRVLLRKLRRLSAVFTDGSVVDATSKQHHHHHHHDQHLESSREQFNADKSSFVESPNQSQMLDSHSEVPVSSESAALSSPSTPLINPWVAPQALQPLSISVFGSTLINSRRCSPLFLELPESYTLASRRFPTLGQHGAFLADKKANVNGGHTKCAPLTGVRREIVRKEAALELLLYEVMFNQTMNKLLHDRSQDAPWLYFLHECVHNPRLLRSRQNELFRDKMIAQSTASLTIPFVVVASDAHQHNELQSMLEMITGTHGGEMVGYMYQTLDPSAYLRLPNSQRLNIPEVRVALNPNYTMDEQGQWHQANSNFRCTVDSLYKRWIQQHPIVIVDAGFFHLVSKSPSPSPTSSSSSASEIVFDKVYNSQLVKPSHCDENSSMPVPPKFEKMAVMVRDPFHRMWKEVFATIAEKGDPEKEGKTATFEVMKLSPAHRELAIEKLKYWMAMHKVFSSKPAATSSGSSTPASDPSVPHDLHRGHSHLHTLAASNSLAFSFNPVSSSTQSNNRNSSDSQPLYELLLSFRPKSYPTTPVVDATFARPILGVSNSRKNDIRVNHANYIHAFHVSLAFNTMREGGNTIEEAETAIQDRREEAFYQEYYSLFFNDFQYHSLFQTHYLAKLQELRSGQDAKWKGEKKIKLDQEELKRAGKIGYIIDERVHFSLQREEKVEETQNAENAHDGDGQFQFFSYDGILDEGFALQMQMLVKYFDEEAFMRSTLASSSQEFFPGNWRDNMNRGLLESFVAFGDLLPIRTSKPKKGERHGRNRRLKGQEKHGEEKVVENTSKSKQVLGDDEESIMVRKRLACAFGSANTIDRDLVLKQLPAMKAFYALNPEILDEVKKVVKDGLELIGLDPRQMHFMYKL
jgi:hypothetical protein